MKAILRTNDFSEPYRIVEILKNSTSVNNSLIKIKFNDEIYYTGGILCSVNENTIKVLNSLSNKEQWEWLLSIKCPNLLI